MDEGKEVVSEEWHGYVQGSTLAVQTYQRNTQVLTLAEPYTRSPASAPSSRTIPIAHLPQPGDHRIFAGDPFTSLPSSGQICHRGGLQLAAGVGGWEVEAKQAGENVCRAGACAPHPAQEALTVPHTPHALHS